MTTSLSCHGCRYIDFLRVAKAENEALIWPTGANTSTFDDLDQFNIELDLVGITPDAREVAFLFDLSPGGIYEHDSEPGMLDIDGDMSLVVSFGHQALEFDSGNVISDQNVVIIAQDTVPLYCYPFDEYKIEMVMRAVLINESDYTDRIIAAINGQPDNTYRETIPVNMSLTYLEGHQGWLTKTTFEPLYDNNGLLVPGCTVMMTMRRSSSVRFFSMFVILLMWFISLTLFVIALNYTFSSSNEVAYDVPALMVGFLFAVPFIRQVQPDVPDIGIIVDIMGFFFNMILIALSTVMVMGALTSRHYRNTKAKIKTQEKRFEAQKLSAMGENHPTSNQPITASAPSTGLDPEAHPIAKDQECAV
jgi:NADH:ubiquinone oxidoreductase subunit 6 (subunit J)